MYSTNIPNIPCVPQIFLNYHVFHKLSQHTMRSTNISHLLCATKTFSKYPPFHKHSLYGIRSRYSVNTMCSITVILKPVKSLMSLTRFMEVLEAVSEETSCPALLERGLATEQSDFLIMQCSVRKKLELPKNLLLPHKHYWYKSNHL